MRGAPTSTSRTGTGTSPDVSDGSGGPGGHGGDGGDDQGGQAAAGGQIRLHPRAAPITHSALSFTKCLSPATFLISYTLHLQSL